MGRAARRYRAFRGLPHSSGSHYPQVLPASVARRTEEALCSTASKDAPWFVVPADNKWFTRLVVSAAIVEAVERLDLTYPKVDAEKKKELATMRAALARETERRAA